MEKGQLLSKNPWWKGKEYFKEDEDYRKWSEKRVKWIPKILSEIKLEPFSLHFILGPRQVGKTTTIKLLIQRLLEKYKPEEIFYFRCDEIKDYYELRDLLDSYFELRKDFDIERAYIFLDEVTFANEWYRTIKQMIDEGKFKNDVLVVSGSATLEIKKQTEFFPGRRGNGQDFIILPLSFREFVKITKPEIYEKLPKITSLDEKEIKENAIKAFLYINDLNEQLRLYFRIGGFPLSINSFMQNRKILPDVKETYLGWIKNDIVKVNKSIETAREILKSVLAKIPSPLSWESVAKETSIKSPKTINSYLNTLKGLFVLGISYYLNLNNLTIEFGKNKKIHLIDPLFYELFEEWCLIEIRDKDDKKAEDIFYSNLVRFLIKQAGCSKEIFYWRNGTEVDNIVKSKNKALGFEVKWVKEANETKFISGKLKEVYTISKNTFDLKKRIIPLSVFLSLLET